MNSNFLQADKTLPRYLEGKYYWRYDVYAAVVDMWWRSPTCFALSTRSDFTEGRYRTSSDWSVCVWGVSRVCYIHSLIGGSCRSMNTIGLWHDRARMFLPFLQCVVAGSKQAEAWQYLPAELWYSLPGTRKNWKRWEYGVFHNSEPAMKYPVKIQRQTECE